VTVGASTPSSGLALDDLVRWISSCALGDQWWLSGGRQGHRGGDSIYKGKEGQDHVHATESIPN
jgi:hypothetical protein